MTRSPQITLIRLYQIQHISKSTSLLLTQRLPCDGLFKELMCPECHSDHTLSLFIPVDTDHPRPSHSACPEGKPLITLWATAQTPHGSGGCLRGLLFL